MLLKAVVSSDTTGSPAVGHCQTGSSSDAMCFGVASSAKKEGSRIAASNHVTTDADCIDHHADCPKWASNNAGTTKTERVLRMCPASCRLCGNNVDDNTVSKNCYGEDQVVPPAARQATLQRLQETKDYMLQTVFVEERYRNVRAECKNRHSECAARAAAGECETLPYNTTLECAPSCFTCEQLDFDTRCPFDPDEPGVWQPGDVNEMFERIVKDNSKLQHADADTTDNERRRYNVTIHSSPAKYRQGPGKGAWLITLDNFLSNAECDRLIQLGHGIGYERSSGASISTAGGNKPLVFDGSYKAFENQTRTSTTAWCKDECHQDPVADAVQNRIELLTGIPDTNSEYLQLLRYEATQFYKLHMDYIPLHRKRPQGPRILTVFLYLNDVESGGGTNFPLLNNVTVQPVKGRAVVWPIVLNSMPLDVDPRTMHEALRVEKGVKYSVNSWLHQRNYKIPHKTMCQ